MLLAITVLEISSGQTNRQTDRQTDRQTNRQTIWSIVYQNKGHSASGKYEEMETMLKKASSFDQASLGMFRISKSIYK